MTHTYNFQQQQFEKIIAHYIHSELRSMKITCNNMMSPNDFRNANFDALRYADERCSLNFDYIPTYEQVNMAIDIYIMADSAVQHIKNGVI